MIFELNTNRKGSGSGSEQFRYDIVFLYESKKRKILPEKMPELDREPTSL